MTTRRLTLIMVLAAALALAGCGSAAKQIKLSESTTTTSTLAPSTTTTPAATTSTTSGTSTTAAKPRTTSTTAPRVTTTTTHVAGGLQLTSASHGTYSVSIGDTIELTLSDAGEEWEQLTVMPPTGPLAPDPSPSPPVNGILAIWTAVQSGTVTLSASEFVLCTPGMVCPNVANIVRLFQVTLVIS